ncbi:MAG: hypothetical protein ACRDNG_08730 [Gaiellaceae bacterium]
MLNEEIGVAETVKRSTSFPCIHANKLPNAGVRETLASGSVHEQDAVSRLDEPS